MNLRALLILVLLPWLVACAALVMAEADFEVGAGQVSGFVFHDRNGDGERQAGEAGLPGVLVSNGLDVVATDADGRYVLPLRGDMNLTVVQPSGWRVALDDRGVPQIGRAWRAGGSPAGLRFGGLPDGPAPTRLDFPLQPAAGSERYRCAIIGDSQTYSNDEVGFFRDSALLDLIEAGLGPDDCMIYVGDVVGDDLDLLDRLLELGAQAGAPQWLVHGNHDLDFDAVDPAHAADSWRQRAMPDYYAFEIGRQLFVALNNVVFPCGELDAGRAVREFCLEEEPRYNGRVSERQMQWLANLLDQVPSDRQVVLLHHIPLVSFGDAERPQHLTDNAAEIHALLAGRPALSVAGHTHTLENHDPGQWFAGWQEHVGVGPLSFRHIIAGAASGSWWLGDLDLFSVPMALQRMGAPKGILMLDFDGLDYRESYRGSRLNPALGQWISFNTPAFRRWYAALAEWMAEPAETRDPVPPVSQHDLEDLFLVTPDELAEGVDLVANVWLGSASTRVEARFDDGKPFLLERSQAGQGEAALHGAAQVDPFSLRRQMSSSRRAVQSRSGDARAQGHEGFRGRSFQGIPGPQDRSMPDRNVHLWRARLPSGLAPGIYRVEVTSTDRHGRKLVDVVILEVRPERPARRWAW